MQNKKILIYLLSGLIIIVSAVGLALVFRPTQKRDQFHQPTEKIIKDAQIPTSAIPQTNPFDIKTNPFKNIKTNPFR